MAVTMVIGNRTGECTATLADRGGQNSYIGFRVDGDWKGTHFNEFNFPGTSGSLALTVTNGAFVPVSACSGWMS